MPLKIAKSSKLLARCSVPSLAVLRGVGCDGGGERCNSDGVGGALVVNGKERSAYSGHSGYSSRF